MSLHVLPLAREPIPPAWHAAWRRMLAEHPSWQSPFFDPDFALAVAAVRDDVELAVWTEGAGESPVGFFPFHRDAHGQGRPIGGALSDYHGVIAHPDRPLDPCELVGLCNLRRWSFSNLVDRGSAFRSHCFRDNIAPFADLSGGFGAYERGMASAGHRAVAKTRQHRRRAERELGTLRYEPWVCCPRVFEQLRDWKSEQYKRTGVPDIFQFAWIRALVKNLWLSTAGYVRARLSALWAGDTLIAAHLGLETPRVHHYWFPAYDPAFAKYSPGRILLLFDLEHAAEQGVERVDFGKGRTQFKLGFTNGFQVLHEGCVELNSVTRVLRRGWWKTRLMVAHSVLRTPAKRAYEWLAWSYLRNQYQ